MWLKIFKLNLWLLFFQWIKSHYAWVMVNDYFLVCQTFFCYFFSIFMSVSMCHICTYVCIPMPMCGHMSLHVETQKFMLNTILINSFSRFIETGALGQSQSSAICLVLLALLLWDSVVSTLQDWHYCWVHHVHPCSYRYQRPELSRSKHWKN